MVFEQVSGYQYLAKLTHKINHHSTPHVMIICGLLVFFYFSPYMMNLSDSNVEPLTPSCNKLYLVMI